MSLKFLIMAVSLLALGAPSFALSESVPEEVKTTISNYIKSHERGDYSLFKKNVSIPFIESNGGESHFKEVLKNSSVQSQYKGARASNIEVKMLPKEPDACLVRFDIVRGKKILQAKSATWLKVKKDKTGKWLVHQSLHDYDSDNGP